MTEHAFQKEAIGSFEAGGRFIALRTDACYPLADGRKDVHKALVLVGSEPSSGIFTAHAYTDGGVVREYAIARSEQAVEFADLAPGHASQWKGARKIIKPTPEGFAKAWKSTAAKASSLTTALRCASSRLDRARESFSMTNGRSTSRVD